MDSLPFPQTFAQIAFAMVIALLANGGLAGSILAVAALVRAYQERGKPAADIHVSNTQGDLNLALAAKAKTEGETGFTKVAIELATEAHNQMKVAREHERASEARARECEKEKLRLERENRELRERAK